MPFLMRFFNHRQFPNSKQEFMLMIKQIVTLVVLVSPYVQALIGILSNVAGIPGQSGFNGDGWPAANTLLNSPCQLWKDSVGSLYFADAYNFRIRKVTSGNIVTTFAGNGVFGIASNQVPPTSTSLGSMYGIGGDRWNNIYCSDRDNNIIYKIDNSTNRFINYFAGTGMPGYSGDYGPATSATINGPFLLFVDYDGNVYIADAVNCVIRKIQHGVITTIIGTGVCGSGGNPNLATAAELYFPMGVWGDSNGYLYVADRNNHVVRKYNPQTFQLTIVAGSLGLNGYSGDGQAATSAMLYHPGFVHGDSTGRLFIADTYNHAIRKVSTSGIISTVAGTGVAGYSGDNFVATTSKIAYPWAILIDNNTLYIADTVNMLIRSVELEIESFTPSSPPTVVPSSLTRTPTRTPTRAPSNPPTMSPMSVMPTFVPTDPFINPNATRPSFRPSVAPNVSTTLFPTWISSSLSPSIAPSTSLESGGGSSPTISESSTGLSSTTNTIIIVVCALGGGFTFIVMMGYFVLRCFRVVVASNTPYHGDGRHMCRVADEPVPVPVPVPGSVAVPAAALQPQYYVPNLPNSAPTYVIVTTNMNGIDVGFNVGTGGGGGGGGGVGGGMNYSGGGGFNSGTYGGGAGISSSNPEQLYPPPYPFVSKPQEL